MKTRLNLKNYNISLFAITVTLIILGVLVVNSANSAYTKKDLIGSIFAVLLIILVSLIDYRKYLNYDWLFYIINLILLVLVYVPKIGYTFNFASRWIKLFGFQLQPSEISKLLLILFSAAYIYKRQDNINSIKNIVVFIILLAIPLVLIVKEPDLSTTVITFLIISSIIIIGGLSLKVILITICVTIPFLFGMVWYLTQPWQIILKSWQQRRLLSFLHPNAYISSEYYQQLNSTLAIGSGKIFGNGLNNTLASSVKNANYLPEPQTDFIFAIIGEDLGFIGTLFTIILLFILVILLLQIASKTSDLFAKLITVGVASYIGLQAFINIGVATSLLPNTGLPLPFISYGLTSLFTSCIMIGICINISSRKNNIVF